MARHAHQVTAMSLAKLQHDAFETMCDPNEEKTVEDWKHEIIEKSLTFEFWDKILQLQLMVLIFIRSHREKDFALYIHVLEELAPWFFALDHTNYARWLPVHIKDMKALPQEISDVFKKNWVFTKSN